MWMCPNGQCNKYLLLKSSKGWCADCGTELKDAPKCRCKGYLSKFDKFCGECGRPTK
jgi:hypothetical protein